MRKKWTDEEIKIAKELYNNELNFREIGERINRSSSSTRNMLVKLEVAKPGRRSEHYYNVGDTVNGLKIIKHIRMKGNYKGYEVQSITYPDEPTYSIDESALKRGIGDSYVSNYRVVEENSLYSIKHVRENIIDVEQAKSLAPNAEKYITFKCEKGCSTKKMKPANLLKYGFSCDVCSRNLPYGQLAFSQYNKYFNLGFDSEKVLPGLPNRRVDFINWSNGYWIEIQGVQHTDKNNVWYESAHKQDLEKRAFAKNSTQYQLIEIDMRISSWDYFKEQINKCKYLPNIDSNAEKAILKLIEKNGKYPIKEIVELYTVEMKSTLYISELFKVHKATIQNILRKANVEIRSGSDAMLKGKVLNEVDIIRLYREGQSRKRIAKKYEVSDAVIKRILKENDIEVRGIKKIINEEELISLYKEGYTTTQLGTKYKVNYTTISNILKSHDVNRRKGKAVRCIETDVTYSSAREATRLTGVSYKSISAVCSINNPRKTAGGYRWEFVD